MRRLAADRARGPGYLLRPPWCSGLSHHGLAGAEGGGADAASHLAGIEQDEYSVALARAVGARTEQRPTPHVARRRVREQQRRLAQGILRARVQQTDAAAPCRKATRARRSFDYPGGACVGAWVCVCSRRKAAARFALLASRTARNDTRTARSSHHARLLRGCSASNDAPYEATLRKLRAALLSPSSPSASSSLK